MEEINGPKTTLSAEFEKLKKKHLETLNAYKSLIQERKTFLNLTDSLPYGMYRIKVDLRQGRSEENWKNENKDPFEVLFVNKRFCEILNIKKEHFTTNPEIIFNYVHEDDRDDFAKKNAQANINQPFKWEGRFVINKNTKWVHFESLPQLLEDDFIIWTGILYDITEHVNAQNELVKINGELVQMNVEKDKFFSIISHDLKGPFNSILGFSELLLENINRGDHEESKTFAEIILSSSIKANNLLSNLIDWSKLRTERMNIIPEYFELNVEIDNVLNLYSEIAAHKLVGLQKTTSKAIIVFADKAMVNTVLRNLVSNAIKFSKQGGRVTITIQNHENDIVVTVGDTGVGISTEAIDKLFRLELNKTTFGTQNEKGTGLGLLLCKEMVEKNNGKIWVESEPGAGAKFHFTIPKN